MTEGSHPDTDPPDRTLTIERVFEAPRDLVFKIFSDPKQGKNWWGPRGFTATHIEMDPRPGGTWRSCLREDKSGEEHWQGGVYREVVEPERLVYTFAWDDEQDRPGHETLVTMTFGELDGKTKFTFHQGVFKTVESHDGHQGGWSESFDRLGDYLATVNKS